MTDINLHILLADDDEDDILFFKDALTEINLPHKLTVVNNGKSVLTYLEKRDAPIDYIFLDINMPKLNGLDCLRSIRSFNPSLNAPVIMLSTSSSHKMISQSYQYGANMYIQKPVYLKDLIKYLTYCFYNSATKLKQSEFVLNNIPLNQ